MDDRDSRIMDAIQELTEQTGHPPAFRDVAKVTSIPKSTVYYRCILLSGKGLVSWKAATPRSLRALR